jgi:hypothetical protein
MNRLAPTPLAIRPRCVSCRKVHARPASARFTPQEAARYLNTTEALLRAWRWKKCGPPHEGSGRFIRYVKHQLDAFMAA